LDLQLVGGFSAVVEGVHPIGDHLKKKIIYKII
jgi:hypothetical protein